MARRFSSVVAPKAVSVLLFRLPVNNSLSAQQSQSLSFDRRLHHRWQYRRFFGQSEVFRLRECIVFRIPNQLGHFRLGITIKAKGSSLGRNRVKRQIRESFRIHSAILGSFDYNVVIPASKKMEHPFPRRLGESLREEVPNVIGPRT